LEKVYLKKDLKKLFKSMDFVSDNFHPGEADDWIETKVKGQTVFAVRVKGGSMIPEFNEGEIAVINPHLEVKSGDYVVIKNDEEVATFKHAENYVFSLL
jgi:phage repressor protein C with HTH and peptisase S24 domain